MVSDKRNTGVVTKLIFLLFLILGPKSSYAYLPLTDQTCALSMLIFEEERFQLKGYQFVGNALIITYVVPYGGVTKIRLYDENHKMLWRTQYVNEQGEFRMILRAQILEPGKTYLFEFLYKKQTSQIKVRTP